MSLLRIVLMLLCVMLAAMIVANTAYQLFGPPTFPMPRCEEDAVIVGNGEFADGYWSRYECGPSLDD